jgi:IclR family transcriptional regulator, acetate operon repressor
VATRGLGVRRAMVPGARGGAPAAPPKAGPPPGGFPPKGFKCGDFGNQPKTAVDDLVDGGLLSYLTLQRPAGYSLGVRPAERTALWRLRSDTLVAMTSRPEPLIKRAMKNKPSVQSLDRGLVILEAVAKSREPVPLGDLTNLLGIDRSSVFRLATTLKRRGFLANPSRRKDYILGSSMWRLSTQYDWGNMLITLSRELVKAMARQINETAHLAVREGKQALFVDHASVNHIISVSGQTGELVPLYCTAHGKALLADLDPDAIRALFGTEALHSHTEQTITSVEQLVQEFAQTKTQGFSTDDGEFCEGIRCVAAPIRDRDSRIVASIGISAPTNRFPKARILDYGTKVVEVSKQISAILASQAE